MKIAKAALASTLFLGTAISTAHAEICLKLNPFIDVIRLAYIDYVDEATASPAGTVGGGSHRLLVGNWTALRISPSKPVVGSYDYDIPGAPGGFRIGLHGTLHDGDCGGHSDVTLDGVIGGKWSLSCDGKVAGFFNNSGTLAQISCDTLTTSAAVTGGKSATQ